MVRFFLFFIIAIFNFNSTFAEDISFKRIEDKGKVNILTPSLDNIKRGKIRLSNGLEAYIISDPSTDMSAAALVVNVGSWSEPKDTPGIAHFLEHMLFLGTSKYPKESEYQNYITSHGGNTNAYTSIDHTAYLFSVNNADFKEALDRFSWFFKEPLFNPSGVNRELHAIDQEYAQNLEKDSIRQYHVFKELGNPDHPNHLFSMGNLSTLKDVSQESLKRFYKEHYSANLMHLIVISPLPLDQLEQLVAEKFNAIPNYNKKVLEVKRPIFSTEIQKQIIYIEPIKSVRELSLIWELPKQFSQQVDTKPEELLSYILGHEGNNSLLAHLKREGLADGLASSGFQVGPENLLYTISIDLTDKGLQQKEKVIEYAFQALADLRKNGVPQYIFDEVKQLSTLRYQYQTRQEVFSSMMAHSNNILYEKLDTYPERTHIIQTFDPQIVNQFLSNLTANRVTVIITAPSTLTHVPLNRKEKWLGVPYAVQPISPELINAWNLTLPHEKITLPLPNPFIPKNLNLVPQETAPSTDKGALPHPQLIVDDSYGKIYFAQDDRFLAPEIVWTFSIKTPSILQGNARQAVLADLTLKALSENLNTYTYNAKLAGLYFSVSRGDNSIDLLIHGYSENALSLLRKVLQELKTIPLSEESFIRYKEALERDYENSQVETPLKQASEILKCIIYKHYISEKAKSKAIKKITYKNLKEYLSSFINQNYVEGILYGNMDLNQAHQFWEIYKQIIGGQAYPKDQQIKKEVIVLPNQGGPFILEKKIDKVGNAVILAIQDGPYSMKARAAHQILGKSIEEPFYSDLRTKQQTGYIVYSVAQEIERQMFNFFAVQSGTHNPRDLLARFELFLENYIQEMDKDPSAMPQFEVIRQSYITLLQKPPTNMQEMASMLNLLGFSYDGDFDWMKKRVEGLKELSFEEYVSFSKELLGNKNLRRFAILLKGKMPEGAALDYKSISSPIALRKLSTFVNKEGDNDDSNIESIEKEAE